MVCVWVVGKEATPTLSSVKGAVLKAINEVAYFSQKKRKRIQSVQITYLATAAVNAVRIWPFFFHNTSYITNLSCNKSSPSISVSLNQVKWVFFFWQKYFFRLNSQIEFTYFRPNFMYLSFWEFLQSPKNVWGGLFLAGNQG